MPGWMLVALGFGAAFLLAPMLFQGWLDRVLEERRRRTEDLLARASDDTASKPPLP